MSLASEIGRLMVFVMGPFSVWVTVVVEVTQVPDSFSNPENAWRSISTNLGTYLPTAVRKARGADSDHPREMAVISAVTVRLDRPRLAAICATGTFRRCSCVICSRSACR